MFICTRLMDSSPPATATGTPSCVMLRAASAIACRPEEQKRLTVWPAAVTGRPARMAHWRAMLPPVAPSGLAQPMRHVLDVAGIDAGALDGVGDDVAAHVGAMREVEDAAHGPADRRAGGGDDDGVDHGAVLSVRVMVVLSRHPSSAAPALRSPGLGPG